MPGNPDRVALIVLASGFSRRLGTNKLLQVLGDMTVIDMTLKNALKSQCDEVLVVLEPDNSEILSHVPKGVSIIENPERQEGIGSSIRAGIKAVREVTDAVIFLNGDQPFVTSGIIDALLEKSREEHCGIVACFVENMYVNPMLFSARFYDSLAEIEGDSGARKIALKNAGSLCKITVDNPAVFHDIDTRGDLERARELYKNKERLSFKIFLE